MGIQVTVLGSAGTFAGFGDACSGYLVECDGYRVLMDAGPGTLANLQAHCGVNEIDAVVLSHAHTDHWVDISPLRSASRFVFDRRGIKVLGGAEHLTLIEQVIGADMAPTFEWSTVTDGSEVSLGPLQFRFSATDHPGETLAMRVANATTAFGYSADTGPGWSLNELGRDLSLAIVEATYLDHQRAMAANIHLTAWQAGALGRLASVRHLALTHLLPTIDRDAARKEGTEAFGSPVHIAAPHLRFEL